MARTNCHCASKDRFDIEESSEGVVVERTPEKDLELIDAAVTVL
jgi:hypothetical protein